MNERIKIIRKHFSLNQKDFAKKLGITQAGVSWMEQSDKTVSDQNIRLICTLFNISETWLRTGEGEMFLGTDESLIDSLATEYNLNEKQKKIVAAFVSMDDKKRETLAEAFFEFIDAVSTSSEIAATIATRPAANDVKLTRAQKELLMQKQLDEEEKGLTSSASITINGSSEDKLA